MWISKSAQKLFYNAKTEEGRKLCLEEKSTGKPRERPDYAKQIQDTLDNYYNYVPQPPPAETSGRTAKNPKASFIRIYHDGVEVPVSYNSLGGLGMEELEYSIRGLTAAFMDPKPPKPVSGWKPRRKFYNINIRTATITGIDTAFVKRFVNPDKRWTLRMRPGSGKFSQGKMEAQFILF
jgi:hypothetical protein